MFVRNFGKGAKWVPGRITEIVSPRNFNVQVGDTLWKRHEEQLRPRQISTDQCTDRESEQQKPDVLGRSQTLLDDLSTTTPHLTSPVETEGEHIASIPNASTLKSVPKDVEKLLDPIHHLHQVQNRPHRKGRSGDILSEKENLRSDSIEQIQFIYELLLLFSFKRGHLSYLVNYYFTSPRMNHG